MSREFPGIARFQADALDVRIFTNPGALADAAAQTARDTVQRAIQERGVARVILATGNSQIEFLNRWPEFHQVDWSRVVFFHMDEYLGLPEDHPASFRRFLRRRIESILTPRKFHYIEGDCSQPFDECRRYAKLLRESPVDLCCCGIGENGHLAFNDPPVADFHDPHVIKLVRLDEACRTQQVGEGHFPNLDAVPRYAFTLTIPALCAARTLVCVVPEARKAPAVRAALQGPVHPACPASWLRTLPHGSLFLDLESSRLLHGLPEIK